ncbi:uncharacterized protein LOC133030539 [Cannabis sativa]|uniref:uncharacterized protein LOC133030539 n=1 Tax=Cannabis sativa TaxID=3483 RepID=UPI0029C9C137|nr:uncharacterized protein LOC133030539 [Cannabis sativa]
MVMKPWNPIDDFTKEEVTNVPTLVQLKGLDIKYWGEASLFKIAGQLGVPLQVDNVTKNRDRLQYPRILIQKQTGKFFVSLIYAFNDEKKREELWADLEELAKKLSEPWILMGDFNEIMNGDERIVRRAQCNPSQRLQDCIGNCNMADLKYSGSFYTWNNKQKPEERIFSKIDREMVNSHWINAFPCSEAVFLPELSFDHIPILVTIYEDRFCGRKPFRYFNMWKQAIEYDNLVTKAWQEDIKGTKMYCIVQKLRRVKMVLKHINQTGFTDIQKTMLTTREALAELQVKLNKEPQNVEFMNQEQELRSKFAEVSKAFASFMAQKAKVSWAKYGDENSHIFHASLKLRRIQNRIFSIEDEHGNWCDSPKKVQHAFLDYYQKLLGTKIPAKREVVQAIVDLGLRKEVEDAIFAIDRDKAPGPDGYGSAFFQDNWKLVGDEIVEAVLSFLNSGKILKEIDTTTITLIPKTKCPKSVVDVRQISCCNVIYN